jgi:hypothetical protein
VRSRREAHLNDSAYYAIDGEFFVPSGIGKSPWNPNAQNGVCLAGLVAHAIESVPPLSPMFVARLTIDILGAVPFAPMTAAARIVRNGRNLQLLEAELMSEGRKWVRASAVRVRIANSPELSTPLSLPGPKGRPCETRKAVEVVKLDDVNLANGAGAWWLRSRADVVQGVPLTTFAALAMATDFASGISAMVSREEWTFANVDISMHLSRAPRGEWFLVDAATESAGNGAGMVHARLGDLDGMIGMSHQTIFLQQR